MLIFIFVLLFFIGFKFGIFYQHRKERFIALLVRPWLDPSAEIINDPRPYPRN